LSASSFHNLADTGPGNVLQQQLYAEVLAAGLHLRRAGGWTDRDVDFVDTLHPKASTVRGRWYASWLDRGLLVTLENDGSWSATAAGDDVEVLDRRLGKLAAALRPTHDPSTVEGATRIRFWNLTSFGASSRTRTLATDAWADVAGNYPRDVRAPVGDLHAWEAPPAVGRLALWHGPPGTGKTYAIRSLAESWRTWCDVDYVVDPDRFFDRADYMVDVLLSADAERWRLLIVEDAGEFVRSNATGAGLGRLLNVTDGLVGQGLRTLVLLTTNEPLEELHPALTRPGRCMSDVRFGPFPAEEAAAWLAARGVEDETDGEVTLAQLYARTR